MQLVVYDGTTAEIPHFSLEELTELAASASALPAAEPDEAVSAANALTTLSGGCEPEVSCDLLPSDSLPLIPLPMTL